MVAAWMAGLDGRLVAQLTFLGQADRLKIVLRANRIGDGSRRENSAEHSWHLALFATVLAEYAAAPVQVGRVVTMLLLHDLVEIECGDTVVFDTAGRADQAEREQAAADVVFGHLPPDQAAELRSLWDEFEAAETADARFAKALDRLHPVLQNLSTRGGTWVDYAVDEDLERRITGGIRAGSPTLWAVAEAVFREAVAQGWLLPAPQPAE